MSDKLSLFKITFKDGEVVRQWAYNEENAIEKQMDYLEEIGGSEGEEILKCERVKNTKKKVLK
jgi:hypothetical protein